MAMEKWGIKISKEGVDVKQPLTMVNKKDFVVISTDTCLKISSADYDEFDDYIITILSDISVPMTFTFDPDSKTNPTEWTLRS